MSRQETSTPFAAMRTNDTKQDEAWTAVTNRNRRFDGHFVYAVTTTGIYCRPSCPSRKPPRENVVLFESPDDAAGAGFRACRRCRPDDRTPTEQAVEHARRYVDRHLGDAITLDLLSDETGLSPHHLQRSLPGTYRRGGKGVSIRYTTMPSAFGWILVAATSRGVCAVSLGDDDAELVATLRSEFPRAAEIERDDDTVRHWAEPVIQYLDGNRMHPVVPLDLPGTDFQRSVWTALQTIPFGQTRTYGELAQMLGRPSAARAVAQACAGNKVALVVPCHRVIRSDGTVSGYRWGKDRKRRLLDLEQLGEP